MLLRFQVAISVAIAYLSFGAGAYASVDVGVEETRDASANIDELANAPSNDALPDDQDVRNLFVSREDLKTRRDELGFEGFTNIKNALRDAIVNIRERFQNGVCDLNRGEVSFVQDCDSFESVVEFLFARTKFNACNADRLLFRSKSFEDIITEAFDMVSMQCFRNNPRFERKRERSLAASKFTPARFEEGTYESSVPIPPELGDLEGRQNQYGWGANFNDECGLGILIHSGGTAAFSTNEYSLPTFTVRDGRGNIVFEGIYDQGDVPQFGIRSALVTQCEGSTVTIIAVGLGKPDGFFLRFDLDLNDYNGKPVTGVSPSFVQGTISPSVRSSRVLNENEIIFAPLFDLDTDRAGSSQLRIFNWREARDREIQINVGDESGNAVGGFIWDFECAKNELDGLCWVNTISGLEDQSFTQRLTTTLYAFPLREIQNLQDGQVITVRTAKVPLQFDFPYSALSVEPIGRDKVVACTLSGWAYRVAFIINIFASGLLDVRRRKLVGIADFIRRLLFLVELGFGQGCNICDRNSCQDIPFNGLTTASTYVWQVTECDNKVFTAILDFSSQFSDQFLVFTLEELVKFSCFFPVVLRKVTDSFDGCVERGTNVLRAYLRTFSARRIFLQSLAASAVYDDRIGPDDFGFDLFFAETSDILAGKATFEPITTSGFRELSPTPECGRGREEVFPFDFDPFSVTDDGIRTMVCHTDENGNGLLVMGSAVFGLNQASNTYTLDLS